MPRNRSYYLLTGLFYLLIHSAWSQTQTALSVRNFGAKGDGKTLDTKAIQATIDAVAQQGGGTVLLPAGRYLSGTIVLKDYVTLRVDAGATLLGSTNRQDYPADLGVLAMNEITNFAGPLVYGEGLQHAGIEGRGIIDGQGTRANFAPLPASLLRPGLVRFKDCKFLTVEDVNLRNSARWTLHLRDCEDVTVRGITLHSRVNRNNDGIDVDGCQRVKILGCTIDSEDDAIVLKSFRQQTVRDIVIADCLLSSFCSALKIGTETVGTFENISISNCTIYESRGIDLYSVDGSDINNVTISNISLRKPVAVIQLRLGDRLRSYGMTEVEKPKQAGRLRNILISNVQATDVEDSQDFIAGIPGHPLENVVLSDIRISYKGGGTVAQAQREIPENTKMYPKIGMFGDLPSYGFFIRHAHGISLRNIQFDVMTKDLRPALVCDDVDDLTIAGCRLMGDPQGQPLIRLKQTRNAIIQDCRPTNAVDTFVGVTGVDSKNILLNGNLLQKAKTTFDLDKTVRKEVLREISSIR